VRIDFAFIDGAHTFDYVLVDFFRSMCAISSPDRTIGCAT